MPYPLPLTRTEAYLAYKAGVIQQSDLKPSLAVPRNGIDAWLAYWTGLAEDYPKREDGTPHILQEEEAYIAYLCGVINEYPEKCLRRVGAYLRYLISARWGRPDHPLNREELYLSLIKTQFIPSGDPSSDIVIDGTAKAPFVDVKMYGDTFQQTYEGKNLFNADTETLVFIDSNGNIIAGSAWSCSDYIKVSPNTTYTWHGEQTGSLGGQVIWAGYDSSQAFISGQYAQVNNTVGTSFTTGASTEYVRVGYRNDRLEKMQLELGSTASDYEPFVGGQPSPNPDYPQPIQTVTGEQTVTVTGKNLVDLNNFQSGSYTAATGELIPYGSRACTVNKIPVKPSSTYAVDNHCTNGYIIKNLVDAYKADGTFIGRLLDNGVNGATFTTTADTAFINLTLSEVSDTMRWGDYQADFANGTIQPQIELGSSSTTYVPYSSTDYPISLGDIELNNLGDTYVDYIREDMGEWKIHKATKKMALSDVTDWGSYAQGSLQVHYFVDLQAAGGSSDSNPILTNGFRHKYFIEENSCFLGGNNNRVCFCPLATLNWNDYIADNNPVAYYGIANPTDTVITNQALIDQLNALKQGGAEEGTTYIKVSATGSNLPGLLYVEAPKYE